MISAAAAALAWGSGRRGVDLAAQLYRVEVFRQHGFTLWDSQWYGGHWTLDYSLLFPPLGAVFGIGPVDVVTAVVATAAFDRLVVGHFGPAARLGSAVFAISVVVEVSIGQLAFFTGEAFGLVALCCLAGTRRRWVAASIASIAATLTSPLAGAFVALALTGWAVSVALERWQVGPHQASTPSARARARARAALAEPVWGAVGVVVVTMVPIGITTLAFPGQGPMPYPLSDWLWEVVVAGVIWVLVGPGRRAVRTTVVLYLLATVGSVAVPSALGGNIGRLEDVFALPLAVVAVTVRGASLWRQPLAKASFPAFLRSGGRRGDAAGAVVAAAVLASFTLSQWSPAFAALTAGAGQPWNGRGYFAPLTSWVEGQPASATSRVEVVPTVDHGEAAYVAPSLALARGWERQLDIADNPLFYGRGLLTRASYLAWLRAEGVGWVALSTAPQDFAGVAEARLVAAGVPGLHLVWRDAHWRVYRVAGPGIVSGPAHLAAISNGRVSLLATRAGTAEVRVRWAAHWRVTSGRATVRRAPGGWLDVTSAGAGAVSLAVQLSW